MPESDSESFGFKLSRRQSMSRTDRLASQRVLLQTERMGVHAGMVHVSHAMLDFEIVCLGNLADGCCCPVPT